ncbi:MAG: MBL fold metallo-hydrolase [Anaerolineae bacterium]|nr:MBL fold metallo-hydrolase [Anaerolineae bacterium]
MEQFSRRDMLKLLGVSALGTAVMGKIAFEPQAARAQGAPTATPIAFFRFSLGAMQLTVIRDAARQQDPAVLGRNAPEGGIAEVMKANNFPAPITTTFNVLLMRNGDKVALFDTGLGVAAGGALVATLELLGVPRDSVTDVVLTHMHPDHVSGALTDGALTFPNATYHYSQAEFDFINKVPSDSPLAQVAATNKAIFEAAGSKLKLYAPDTEILPGVTTAAAYGHTLGHTIFRFQSEGQQMLHAVDTALNSVVSLARPEWHTAFDVNGEMAAETRRRVFGEAAKSGTRIFAYHFPFPGTGFVVAEGEGFRFIPAM